MRENKMKLTITTNFPLKSEKKIQQLQSLRDDVVDVELRGQIDQEIVRLENKVQRMRSFVNNLNRVQ